MKCFFHPETDAVAACQRCGKFSCKRCIQDMDGVMVCTSCTNRAEQEIQREQQLILEQEAADWEEIQRRAIKKIRWSWVIAGGTFVFISLITMEVLARGEHVPMLQLFLGPFAAYYLWSVFWGLVWFWPKWRRFVASFRQKLGGWFIIAKPVTWLFIILFYFLFYITVPFVVAMYYGLFGGGIYQYRQHRKLTKLSV